MEDADLPTVSLAGGRVDQVWNGRGGGAYVRHDNQLRVQDVDLLLGDFRDVVEMFLTEEAARLKESK